MSEYLVPVLALLSTRGKDVCMGECWRYSPDTQQGLQHTVPMSLLLSWCGWPASGLSRVAVLSAPDLHLKACCTDILSLKLLPDSPLATARQGQKAVMGPIFLTRCRRQNCPPPETKRRIFCSLGLFRIFSLFPQKFVPCWTSLSEYLCVPNDAILSFIGFHVPL